MFFVLGHTGLRAGNKPQPCMAMKRMGLNLKLHQVLTAICHFISPKYQSLAEKKHFASHEKPSYFSSSSQYFVS